MMTHTIQRIRDRLADGLADLMVRVREAPASVSRARGRVAVIYHGVCEGDPHLLNARFVHISHFEKHLQAFSRHARLIHADEFLNPRGDPDGLEILITFDDGYRNNFTNALPVLKRYGVPAVFFVTGVAGKNACLFNDVIDLFSLTGPEEATVSGIIYERRKVGPHYRYFDPDGVPFSVAAGKTEMRERDKLIAEMRLYIPDSAFEKYAEYVALMNGSELTALADDPLFAVGSHTYHHSDLSKMSLSEQVTELLRSKADIESRTARPCKLIAFPYGNYNGYSENACRRAGFSHCFGTEKLNRPEDAGFVIPRLTINPYISAVNQLRRIAKTGNR